ncbi:unnamed protein product, partial [Ilex paraguariensis]
QHRHTLPICSEWGKSFNNVARCHKELLYASYKPESTIYNRYCKNPSTIGAIVRVRADGANASGSQQVIANSSGILPTNPNLQPGSDITKNFAPLFKKTPINFASFGVHFSFGSFELFGYTVSTAD